MIVVFEGLDNCGKTTLTTLLEKYYNSRGISVEISKEMQTPVGETLKSMIVSKDVDPILKSFLFAADRYYRMRNKTYEQEVIYIFDRYVPSAVAYREAEGIDSNWIKEINKIFPNPDLCFLIDITPDESIKRNIETKFNIKYSKEFLSKVRTSYENYSSEYNMVKIDGMQNIEDIMSFIILEIDKRMNQTQSVKLDGQKIKIKEV